jgi:nucleoid-associated protein YgaU
MGLFDFVKSIGHQLFSEESQAAQKIKETIETNNPGIKNLTVDYKNSTVYLGGDAESPEAVQKAVLMAGNLQGVESVNVDGVKIPAAAATPTPTAVENYANIQYYVVQSGDTLSKIARQFYGSTAKYTVIFEANREVIKDPDLIFPGQKIRIPPDK